MAHKGRLARNLTRKCDFNRDPLHDAASLRFSDGVSVTVVQGAVTESSGLTRMADLDLMIANGWGDVQSQHKLPEDWRTRVNPKALGLRMGRPRKDEIRKRGGDKNEQA